jgi:hypothetical protein
MDFEAFLKQIQSWTNSVPLIILGSGASVPFGISSMYVLGKHLKESISFSNIDDQTQFDSFKDAFDKNTDLETILLNLQLRDAVLQAIICETWKLINEKDIELYEKLLQDTTNFPLTQLISHLLTSSQKRLSIITTNYDRLAEYASSLANAFICNGFSHNFRGHFSKNIHKNDFSNTQGYAGQVNIWKVHGSLDWFKSKDDIDFHLPLRKYIPTNYIPSIVTPGLSKYYQTQLEPYRTIFTEADSEIEKATSFLCIGYGFNDVHVQPKLITQIKNGKPIIVITKELTENTKRAIINNQCKQYILIEQVNINDTRIYSSFSKEEIVANQSYWTLSEYIKLIK